MAESNYQKQTWKKYDAEKDILTNIAQGGVATSERLNHMEDGIEKANIPYTVGNVTTGPTASVTINDDNSIDFVFPQNTGGGVVGNSGSNFTVSTASPSPENTITKSDVLNSDDVSEGDLIMCPDGAIYEVITVGADNFTVENKNVSINTGGGKSAYDIWKEQPGNEGKSEEEFLESLKGEPGDAGIQGATGQSAYELWKTQFGNENKSEQDFLDSLRGDKGDPGDVGPTGADGQSAYELWKAQEGNENKTETDFLNALKGAAGEAGEDGQSAYELWKSQPGNENKTEKEFLASLKGEKGDKGDPGQSTGEGGGTMAIGHPTLGAVSVLNEGSNDVKLSVKYTDPANEGVPYGGMLVAVKEDSYPESPTDCDWSVDVMTKDKHKSTALEIPIENNKGTERNLYLTLFPYSSDRVYNMLKREKWSKEGVKFLDKSILLAEKSRYDITYTDSDNVPISCLNYLIKTTSGEMLFTNSYGGSIYKYDPSSKQISVVATLDDEEKKKLTKYSDGSTITNTSYAYSSYSANNIIEFDGEIYTAYTYNLNSSGDGYVAILKMVGNKLTVFANLDELVLGYGLSYEGQSPCILVELNNKLVLIPTTNESSATNSSRIAHVDTSSASATYLNNLYFIPYSNILTSADKRSFYVFAKTEPTNNKIETGVVKVTLDDAENELITEIVAHYNSSDSLSYRDKYALISKDNVDFSLYVTASYNRTRQLIIKKVSLRSPEEPESKIPDTTVLSIDEELIGSGDAISDYPSTVIDDDSLLTLIFTTTTLGSGKAKAVKIGLKNES